MKILEMLPRKAIAFAVIVVQIALIVLITHHPTWMIELLSVIISAGVCLLVLFYSEWRAKTSVNKFTKEVSNLAQNLEIKEYENIPQEQRAFYDALNQVKHSLAKRGKTRQELLEVINAVASQMEISKLLRDLLPRINDATRSTCSAFYALNTSTNKLELKHSVGFSKNIYSEFDVNLGEGMIGGDANKQEITYYDQIPEDTVYFIRTFLGKMKPKSMMSVPIITQGSPSGLLVCASIYDYTSDDKGTMELIRHYVGVAVSNSVNYERSRRLTNELTFHNKLMQEQHEQMKARVDEKSNWLNSLLHYIHNGTAFAVDTKGTIVIWNDDSKSAVGKPIDRICEDNSWPSLSTAIQKALTGGSSVEPADGFDFELRCVYNERQIPVGVLIFIFRS